MKKKHRVSELELEELSLVDRPANVGSRSVLFKRDTTLLERVKRLFKGLGAYNPAEPQEHVGSLTDTLSDSLSSILVDPALDPEARDSLMEKSLQEFREALDVLPELTKADSQPGTSGPHTTTEGDDVTLEEAMAKIAELEAKLTENTEKGKTMTKAEDLVVKLHEIDPEAAEALAKAQSTAADLEKRLAAAEARELTRERLTKAKFMARKVPVEHGKLANVLAKLSDEDADVLEGVFKAADAALESLKLFKEMGDVVEIEGGADALEVAVTKVMEAHPTLTRPQAVSKALEINPELYELATS